ncbi:MAG TPA: Rieske 2Fe-2S domain-containing protein [Acidimicrobiales bacterium]|nr:Rieske 2Fe-2S domain-containing protein [Acidimicrobiales bacterium]
MPTFVNDTELLNQTGPGTELGELLRRFWVPALPADELPLGWSAPVRVQLMGERLVCFRDMEGRIAFLQELCAHRRASLFFGRNEGESSPDGQVGLRCAYHGWKYDVDGRCIDMPNEPAASRFKEHVQLTSYPGVERGGIIWAYMGPAELMPALPELEWAIVPSEQRFVSRRLENTCFTQAMEGGIDSSHVSFLHADIGYWSGSGPLTQSRLLNADTAPRFFIEPTEYGLLIGARRNAPDGGYYWRITQWLMPWYTFIPRDGDGAIGAHAWVPIDDTHCMAWSITYHPERALNAREREFCTNGLGIHAICLPGTNIPIQNEHNDYLIDRRLQAHMISISGISGVGTQDSAMQESMGPEFDPSRERLGSSDAAIVASRSRLVAEAHAVRDGGTPSGLEPVAQRVRSTTAILTEEESWVEATAESRQADSRHYSTLG